MNWKLIRNSTFAAVSCGSLAAAGQLQRDDLLNSAVRLNNGVSLGCAMMRCGSSFGPAFKSLDNTAATALAIRIAGTAIVNLYQLQTEGMATQFSTLSAIRAALSTPAAASLTADNSTQTIFVLANGRIIETSNGVVDATTGAPVVAGISGPTVVAYGDNSFPDPIVSPAFNTYSTSLANSAGLATPAAATAVNTTISMPVALVTADRNAATSLISTVSVSDLSRVPSPSTPPAAMVADVAPAVAAPAAPPAEPASDGSLAPSALSAGVLAPSDTPEPSTELLIGAGLLLAGILAKGRRR